MSPGRGASLRSPRAWWGRLRGLAKPLTISQVLSSAGGVLPMLVAAHGMGPRDFATFALLNLAANTLLSLQRAGLLQPALMHRRHDKAAFVPARYALVGAVVGALGLLGVSAYLHVRDPQVLVLLTATALVPAFYDWLRYAAMGHDRRWAVAQGDGIRLVLVLVVLLVPVLRSNPYVLQSFVSACLVVPAAWLLITLPRVTTWSPFRGYARSAGWQTVDFAFGQTLVTVPLLVLGGTGSVGLIAGVRLAQSLLGPLNLMFSAGTTNLVADGATRAELSGDRALLARGGSLGRLLSAAAVVCVLVLLAFFSFSGLTLNGVAPDDVLWGLVLNGSLLVTLGWSGVRAIVLRLLGLQAVATLARIVVSVVTAVSFVLGYLAGGTDTSLVCGFAALTVSSPLVFWLCSRRSYAAVRDGRPVARPAHDDTDPPTTTPDPVQLADATVAVARRSPSGGTP